MDNALPVKPLLLVQTSISQPHVEIWGKYEGEKSNCGGPNQVKDCTKAWNSFCNEKKTRHGEGAEDTSLPVEFFS